MRITLARTGGFAGLRQETSVDTDKLPGEEAGALAELVERAGLADLARRSPIHSRGADRFQYDLTVDRERERHHISVAEDAVPSQLRPLIEELLERGLKPSAN